MSSVFTSMKDAVQQTAREVAQQVAQQGVHEAAGHKVDGNNVEQRYDSIASFIDSHPAKKYYGKANDVNNIGPSPKSKLDPDQYSKYQELAWGTTTLASGESFENSDVLKNMHRMYELQYEIQQANQSGDKSMAAAINMTVMKAELEGLKNKDVLYARSMGMETYGQLRAGFENGYFTTHPVPIHSIYEARAYVEVYGKNSDLDWKGVAGKTNDGKIIKESDIQETLSTITSLSENISSMQSSGGPGIAVTEMQRALDSAKQKWGEYADTIGDDAAIKYQKKFADQNVDKNFTVEDMIGMSGAPANYNASMPVRNRSIPDFVPDSSIDHRGTDLEI